MKVQIISKETIKPSSPTPENSRTYKLCLLDQFCAHLYGNIILFYSGPCEDSTKSSESLKNSLSETLTHFYPLAGRTKDIFTVDCNDEGADFIEAQISSPMSEVLNQPDRDVLQQLLPRNILVNETEFSNQAILALKVNHFSCGGMAIGLCLWHGLGDASTAVNFLKTWAEIARGVHAHDELDSVVYDCTSLFPPQDLSGFLNSRMSSNEDILSRSVTRRFLFDSSKIASLKERIGKGSYLENPTRYEAVSALIWGAAIAAAEKRDGSITMHVATNPVDLRKRLDPPLPTNSLGNIMQVTIAHCPAKKEIDYNFLAAKIRESIKRMNHEYLKKVQDDGGFLNSMKKAGQEFAKSSQKVEAFSCASCSRFPFHEIDFGWGKPIWKGTVLNQNNMSILMDSSDGEGLEAWVGMCKEDIANFEQNPDILEYVSLQPGI